MKFNANKLAKMGMLSALSIILMMLVRFPIIPAAPFLEYEPADVPILIGTFLYGPIEGLIITIVVSVIQALTVSSRSGWIGAVMHIVATGSFVIIAGWIYKRIHTLKGAIIALVAGSFSMTVVMVGLNLYVTPKFLNTPVEVVIGLLLPAIIPFNLIKSFGNSLIVMLVYKSIGRILKIPQKKTNHSFK